MPKRANYKQRQAYAEAHGYHPLAGDRLLETPGHTCGDCGHCFANDCAKRYYKCDRNATGGPATDVRLRWPACRHWEPKGEES